MKRSDFKIIMDLKLILMVLLTFVYMLVLRFINNLNKVVTSYIVGSSCMLEESHGYWTTKSTAGACR